MSDLPPVEGRVIILVTVRGSDGRLTEVEALPPADATEDTVPTWDYAAQTIVWRTPAELGFTPTPMLIDVPIVTGDGSLIVESDDTVIVCNIPSTGA